MQFNTNVWDFLVASRYGRVPTMLLLNLLTVIVGTMSAFSPYYELFLVGIWFCGFAVIGFGTVAYCWMMELLTGREKTIFGCAPHFNFAFWSVRIGFDRPSRNWYKRTLTVGHQCSADLLFDCFDLTNQIGQTVANFTQATQLNRNKISRRSVVR